MAKSTNTGEAQVSPVSLSGHGAQAVQPPQPETPPEVKAEEPPAASEKKPRRFVVCRSGWLARHFGYVPSTTESLIRQRGFDPDECVKQGLLRPIP